MPLSIARRSRVLPAGWVSDKEKKHIDELLDDALKGTFPASDPVSVGRFTSTAFR
jgi:hypothetical protein